jgi:Predicted nucleic acid-binding protein, contains PIN domain
LRYALDADILIGALDSSDAHHQQSRRLFVTWRDQDTTLIVSVINLSEVLIAPAADQKRLRAAREAVAALGVTIHSPTEAIGVDASRLRSRHPISLPDGYLLATAKHTAATAVSFDRKVLRAAKAESIPASVGGSSR